MRILLLYPPPWKIPVSGEDPDQSGEGPPEGFSSDYSFTGDEVTVPYGLLTLAAQAKRAGHDVIPLNLFTFAWRDVSKFILHTTFDIYGLSCFTANRRGTLSLARLIRKLHPKAYIVAGGPHASALPREMLEHCGAIDGIVIGEGEATFVELVEAIENRKSLSGIAGLAWQTGHGVEIGPLRERIDELDSIASPRDYYQGHHVISSRGCPGNCTFCGSPAMWGKKVRFHSADYLLNMIEKMVNNHGKKVIAIKDDTFTFNRKRVLQICDGIVKRNLHFLWSCDTRVDVLDEEVLFAMRKAGCQRISLGVESASPEILRTINKHITPKKVFEATQMAKKFGLEVRYYMMAGNRGETAETLQASVDFIIEAKPNQFIFSFLSLYPGTKEFEIAERTGLISREIFFSENHYTFGYILGTDSPQRREIVNWIKTHSGVNNFWDYGIAERQSILDLFPHLPAAHMDLGGAYYQAGNLAEAEIHVRNAIDMGYPQPGLGYNYLFCIAVSHGDIKGSLKFLEEAKRLGPHSIVDRNMELLRTWLGNDGIESGKRPNLLADHCFESLRFETQPSIPAPITLQCSTAPNVQPTVLMPQK